MDNISRHISVGYDPTVHSVEHAVSVRFDEKDSEDIRQEYLYIIDDVDWENVMRQKAERIIESLTTMGFTRFTPNSNEPICMSFGSELIELKSDVILIGKKSNCDITLNSPSCSRLHAVMFFLKDCFGRVKLVIVDFWSLNGTRIVQTFGKIVSLPSNDPMKLRSIYDESIVGNRITGMSHEMSEPPVINDVIVVDDLEDNVADDDVMSTGSADPKSEIDSESINPRPSNSGPADPMHISDSEVKPGPSKKLGKKTKGLQIENVGESVSKNRNILIVDGSLRSLLMFGDRNVIFNPQTCIICYEQPRTIRFQCGHAVVCDECSKSLAQCPLCRQIIIHVNNTNGMFTMKF